MGTLGRVYDTDNLARAWRWLLSNPDASYKGYFRHHYANYNVAATELLNDLRDRLHRGVYAPARACKLFLPKPSGVLRPLSLLTVEDQIVYQAVVNVVADRLYPATRNLAAEPHDKRGESSLSHPVKKGKAGVVIKVAGRIRYGYRYWAKRFISLAVAELAKQAAAKGW